MAGESLTISTKQQLPIFGKRFPQSPKGRLKFLTNQVFRRPSIINYSGLNLNQDKATKPQTVQVVRQGEATPYWFKFNPL